MDVMMPNMDGIITAQPYAAEDLLKTVSGIVSPS
jgi:hypothetical protein